MRRRAKCHSRYKLGDSFLWLPVSEVQELLEESVEKINNEVSLIEKQLDSSREEMERMKVALYARFGKSINLDR